MMHRFGHGPGISPRAGEYAVACEHVAKMGADIRTWLFYGQNGFYLKDFKIQWIALCRKCVGAVGDGVDFTDATDTWSVFRVDADDARTARSVVIMVGD